MRSIPAAAGSAVAAGAFAEQLFGELRERQAEAEVEARAGEAAVGSE